MRTNDTHGYHGITYVDKGWGWSVQIKLLGQYRLIRAFAQSAEQTARRHDIALSILEAFTPPTTRPNFPDVFKDIPYKPAEETIDKDERDFRAEVMRWRDILTQQVTDAGGDVVDLEIQRSAEKAALVENLFFHQRMLESKMMARIVEFRRRIKELTIANGRKARLLKLVNEMANVLAEKD